MMLKLIWFCLFSSSVVYSTEINHHLDDNENSNDIDHSPLIVETRLNDDLKHFKPILTRTQFDKLIENRNLLSKFDKYFYFKNKSVPEYLGRNLKNEKQKDNKQKNDKPEEEKLDLNKSPCLTGYLYTKCI